MLQTVYSHLRERGLNLARYASVNVVTGEDNVVIFWLNNLSGQFIGYVEYRPFEEKLDDDMPRTKRRYYPYVVSDIVNGKKHTRLAVWGLETLSWDSQYLFVVEGIFDAVRLHNLGFPCVAVLSCNPMHLSSWLATLPHTKVGVLDGDQPGLQLANHVDETVLMPWGKDAGSMGDLELALWHPMQKYFK